MVDAFRLPRAEGGLREESSCDVTLGGAPSKFDCHDHGSADCGPAGNQGPHLKVVNSFSLFVTTDTEASFVKIPRGMEDFHGWVMQDEFPTSEQVCRGMDFFLHVLVEILFEGTSHCLAVGEDIFGRFLFRRLEGECVKNVRVKDLSDGWRVCGFNYEVSNQFGVWVVGLPVLLK